MFVLVLLQISWWRICIVVFKLLWPLTNLRISIIGLSALCSKYADTPLIGWEFDFLKPVSAHRPSQSFNLLLTEIFQPAQLFYFRIQVGAIPILDRSSQKTRILRHTNNMLNKKKTVERLWHLLPILEFTWDWEYTLAIVLAFLRILSDLEQFYTKYITLTQTNAARAISSIHRSIYRIIYNRYNRAEKM